MPIPIDDYKKGIEPEDAKLLNILEHTPYQAYSIYDFLPKTENKAYLTAQAFALGLQFNRLIDRGLVKSKVIGGIIYYISAKAAL
jgi:hypothetical protein